VQRDHLVVEDAGELGVAPLPVGGALDPEVVLGAAIRADRDDRQGRRLAGLHGPGQVDAVAGQMVADPAPQRVGGDAGQQARGHAQPGQPHRHVRGAATGNRLE
jgi:hypothetical protein